MLKYVSYRKLCTEESQTINDVLKNIGLVCSSNSMKMYTMYPSKIFYYKQNITSYNPHRNQYSPTQDVSVFNIFT